ncbi:MAG: TldD/PmbA family protein [Synechococcaceae cyanobacterium SM2_3_1]|nr:TldD/PmbA family protein [Synechococcaceae cyanobacterium SM2_3_1]
MPGVQEIAAAAQASAQRLGIRKYDIYGSIVDDTSVQVDHGEAKQVKASNRAGVVVRVWNPAGTVGVTSTTDVDAVGLELALQTALEASPLGVSEHIPDFSPEATAPLAEAEAHRHPLQPAADLLEKLLEAEQQLLAAHPAIQGVPYNGLSQRDADRFYLNSEGALRQEAGTQTSLYLYSRTDVEGKKPRSAGAVRLSYQLADLDVAGCIQEAAEKTISHLDYQPIVSGKYMVVFSPEAFLSLIGAFSNLFNAQAVLDRQSLATPETLGTSIASPLFSLADESLHPERIGGNRFDSEGTPTRRVEVVKEGILTQFLHSSVTARRLGAQPTGHGGIGAKVSVSPHFYQISTTGAPDPSYQLDQVDNVVLIDDLHALHAGVKATQGSFSLPFDGWLLKQGERISIESATVAGDFLSLLKSIVYLDPQAEVTPAGVCPRVWVCDLAITGES